MKVFLDDVRSPNDGWQLVRWPEEAISLLKTGDVRVISLDHDLGDDTRGTGYDVVLWIEEQVAINNFLAPKILVHSSNTSAREKMLAGIARIEKFIRSKTD